MRRRRGQNGSVFQVGQKLWDSKVAAHGRYWVDSPDGRRRKTIRLGFCRTKTEARRKLRDYIESIGLNSKAPDPQKPDLLFREQAERWITSLPTRRRKPVKPATVSGWRHSLDKWILPAIGDMELSQIGNAALKQVIDKMSEANLSAPSIVMHSAVVKMVVASAVDAEGEPLFVRKWNDDFVGLPFVDRTKQHRPSPSREELEHVLAGVLPRYRLLVALLAATGLRIGEALGLKTHDVSPDGKVIHIQRSVYKLKEQQPKTPYAVRLLDIPEELAGVLRGHIAGKSGYLFPTRTGRPLGYRNVVQALHSGGASWGFHALRRFRTETLRRAAVPEDLIRFWLGWAPISMSDRYAWNLREDIARRQEWAARAGLGFSLLGLKGLRNSEPTTSIVAA